MLKKGLEKIIVDVIEAGGTIMPPLIEKTEDKSADYIFKIESLNNPRSSQQVYLDGKMQVAKKVLSNRGITLERSSEEIISAQFPEQIGFILKMIEPARQ